MEERCKHCGAEQDEHYDGVQCPLRQGLYSTENSFQRVGEVEWRVSPQVFSDLHTIIGNHLTEMAWDEARTQLDGIPRTNGADAAALEISEKYGLRKGIPLKLVVDYKMGGYDRPDYWKLEGK